MAEINARWNAVDQWWSDYARDQESGLIELYNLLEKLNQTWEQSDCRFDQDPLVGDWTETSPQAGPLRTNQEENWSQWLAHLIRDSTGEYAALLFGPQFDRMPTRVRCERAYHDEELHDRRVDILAEFGGRGITIEVKIGDEHYAKTPQTAYLTEKHHRRDLEWTHYLLLPETKHGELAGVFDDRLDVVEGRRPTISASGMQECDVTVLYWSEVAQTLRETLLANSESALHWCASAYLFTTLIEEQILQFYALPSLQEYRQTSLGVSDIERLQSIEPDDQIEYLDGLLEATNHG